MEAPLEACYSKMSVSEEALSSRSVEALLLTAQQQQLRHLRRLQQLRRQAEITAAQQAAWEEKQQEEERRRQEREEAVRLRQLQRMEQARETEARNAAALEAAMRSEEMWRESIAQKLEAAKERTDEMLRQRSLLAEYARLQSARIEARRQRTLQNHERAIEARRQALLEKEAQEERNLKQQQELRMIQEEIRREEEALAAVRREEARKRAEAEAEERSMMYALKQAQREQQLAERKQDMSLQRAARAEEARQRAEYNQQRAAYVAAMDQAKRDRLAAKLENKMAKVDAIMSTREALVREVKLVQHAMTTQEQRLRQAVQQMQHTGKWNMPDELADSSAALELAMSTRLSLSRQGSYGASSFGGYYDRERPSTAPSLVADTKVFRTGNRPGTAPVIERTRSQDAELQRVLEEEIVAEMEREKALAEETDNEERKRLIKQFAAEREDAKARILSVGSRAKSGLATQ